jgi:outer membrane protein OmpA-like peptidoglycan-associated protein
MIGKKYAVLAGFLLAFLSQSFAQDNTSESSSSYDIRDSSLIPAKRIPQHNEFLNNAYPFPAKPRNEWELGIKGGLSTVSGDVRAWLPTFGFGLHARKALGYTFSVRLEYDYMVAKGLNWQPSYTGYAANNVLAGIYNANGSTPVFYNYHTTIQELALQGVVNLNNIRFHRAKSNIAIYVLGGFGLMTYSTLYNALDASGNPYNYQAIVNQFGANGFTYANRKAIKSALKNMLDGTFETVAQRDNSQPTAFGIPFRPVLDLGAGAEIKLSEKFNIAIEDKVTITKTDLLDGQEWQETGTVAAHAMTRDYDSYNFLSVGLNYNIGKKAVEPLWWINPLDYAYSEINAPRHMKLPKPVLDDADGDGVTDQFDHEPNTPAGCPVDTHGVSLDTDGDGVPDCRDKEKITPTQCQPVDADGVGKCPDPACCKEINARLDSGGVGTLGGRTRCFIGDLPSIVFKGRSVTLSKDGKALASTIAEKMRNNPGCKVAVIGYGESSKSAQQLSWDRVNEVIKYLVEKEGINSDRFIFRYGQTGGDENTIDIKDGTGEEGPNTVPAPHPNLRKK